MRQWEIWDVRWRHEDGEKKKRPALILSTDEEIAQTGLFLAMKFSREPPKKGGKLLFMPTDPDWAQAGLTKRCYLWLGSAREMDMTEAIEKRGELSAAGAAWVQKHTPKDPEPE